MIGLHRPAPDDLSCRRRFTTTGDAATGAETGTPGSTTSAPLKSTLPGASVRDAIRELAGLLLCSGFSPRSTMRGFLTGSGGNGLFSNEHAESETEERKISQVLICILFKFFTKNLFNNGIAAGQESQRKQGFCYQKVKGKHSTWKYFCSYSNYNLLDYVTTTTILLSGSQ
ncbi:hypothetical protein ACHMW6_00360 (plasmid) [Pseudoduganella sp. UC29_106]|uniref:hypothetical protein n=1 Tax=Pseudoduganella sp. UC29_106 TaxID=3374553 RepID=UPI0037578D7E